MMTDKRILVVEDDLDNQEMIATLLQHMEFIVDTADDGEQASATLSDSDRAYHAVIIDLALPGKDGWELLREIQDNPATEDIPCIAVTAYHNSKLREEALHAGFVAYFAKPVDTMQFQHELDRVI